MKLPQDEKKGGCLAEDGCEGGVEKRFKRHLGGGSLSVVYQQGRWSGRELWCEEEV